MYPDLREESAHDITALDFPGYAIGGLSVGESAEQLADMTAVTTAFMPEDRPRYLMGVGLPENMRAAIEAGVDMFDCVAPTRLARHGQFFASETERCNISNERFKADQGPLVENCQCPVCQSYSRGLYSPLIQGQRNVGSHVIKRA